MSRIYDLIANRKLYAIDAGQTVLEAAQLMTDHRIGALPVLRDGELAGVFSERDVMTRVVAQGRSPGLTRIGEVMTANPRTVSVDESLENCLFIMRELGVRHLPVCEGKALKGLISLRDLMFGESELKKAEVA
jgi:CBS domain-containing protein